jgi:PAS domain S-box-containing protein
MASKKNAPGDSELRRRAEEKLAEPVIPGEDLSNVSPEKMAGLIHELQIHQIELEMQNDELCRIQEELERARNKYSHLYDFAPVGYFTLSEKGIIEEANLTMASMLGIERVELIGKPFTRFISRDDQDIFYKHRQRLLETEASLPCEMRLIKKDNQAFHARMECMLIKSKDDDSRQIRAAVSDITEYKQMEGRLHQSQKMESIGILAGGIAHDFNNILAVIMGNTEMALDEVQEWNSVREYLNEIQSAATRAKNLILHILNFSRKGSTDLKPINIGPIVTETLKFLRATIPADIEIRQDISCKFDMVEGNQAQIGQVIMNLCTNAAHAMHDGGGILEVSLQNVEFDKHVGFDLEPGRYLKLTVTDNGHGIDPANIDHIFDPYFTTGRLGNGTGMGLSLVYGIVKAHNGAVTVKSEPGKGTVFEVLFPSVAGETEPEVARPKLFPKGNERILFIDDEEHILNLAKKMLDRHGYQVEVKNSPADALELFRSGPDRFDLIITDMTMPMMNGYKLAQEILSICPDMPVILCSGYSDSIDVEKTAAIGIRKFIEKPLDMSDFLVSIRKVLDETRKASQK